MPRHVIFSLGRTCGRVWTALLLTVPALHAAPNLAPNPSFEQGLAHWQLWSDPNSQPATLATDRDGRHGTTCAAVRSPNGRAILWSDPIPLNEDADYTLSAYARTTGVSGAHLSLWVQREGEHSGTWVPSDVTAGQDSGLLRNPDFREGEVGWSLWHGAPGVSSGEVVNEGRNGGKAFRVTNPGTHGANLHSDPVPCVAGKVYSLFVYAKTQNAKGAKISVWGRDADGKTLSYAVSGSIEVPEDLPGFRLFSTTITAPKNSADLKAHLVCQGGQVWWAECLLIPRDESLGYELRGFLELPGIQPAWARFKHIVRTPVGCTSARILLAAGSGDIRWDAVQLEPGRDTTLYTNTLPSAGLNLLPNSGFEQGREAWVLWHQHPGRSEGTIVEEEGRVDGRAFAVSNSGDGGANLFSETVPCVVGHEMTLSAYVRVSDGKEVLLAAWGLDGVGKTVSYAIDEATPIPDQLPQFTRFSKTFTVPDHVVGLRAHLICNGGNVWWADVQLERGGSPTSYTPGPVREQLATYSGHETVAYTRAIIREARLRDVLAQSERLVSYAPAGGKHQAEALLAKARSAVETVTGTVEGQYLVPAFQSIAYDVLQQQTEAAEIAMKTLWDHLECRSDRAFDDWAPAPLLANIGTQQLAREFVIFPCFTRPYFFSGKGNWALLKPFAFRLISGWWGVRSNADGDPITDGLATTLEISWEQGYPCDITFDPAAAAARALGNREEFFLHNAEGSWSPRGNCHNTVNIWHPDVRRVAAAFSEKVAAHYAKKPGLLSYEMTNEPALSIQQHVHGYEFLPDGVGGYSPEAKAAWRAWLAERHGSIAALNRRWHTQHDRFESIEPPTNLVPSPPENSVVPVDCGRLHDFQRFRADSHADWFKMCLQAFHRGDPDKAVISQFVSSPMQRKDAAVDLRAMAEDAPWGFYGTHDWPGDRPAVESLYATSMNHRSRHPHWEDEFIWSQWERKGTPEPVMRAALERNLWRQIAWGKRGISLFNLESEWAHDSPHNWNNSMLNIEADLAIPRYSTGIIPTIERKVNRFKHVLYGTTLGPTDVALLRPTAATLVSAPDGRSKREGIAVAEVLLQNHCLPLIIPEEHVADSPAALAGIRVLIAPWAINVPRDVQAGILDWVTSGGILIASGPFGLFDEFGSPAGQVLRAGIGDQDWRYDVAAETWTRSREQNDNLSLFCSVPCGEGKVALFASPIITQPQQELMTRLCAEAVPVPLVRTAMKKVEIVPRRDSSGQLFLFVTNLSARAAVRGTIIVRGSYAEVTDLSCDATPRVPVTRETNTTAVPVSLPAGGAVFLQLKPSYPRSAS